MDTEKLITKIIFGTENLSEISLPVNENIKENFEIAWDIWENFGKIKNFLKSKYFKFFRDLNGKAEEELPLKEHGFIISKLEDWGGLYISKPEWIRDDNDKGKRGICAIAVEKWDGGDYYFAIGIMKNDDLKTDIESKMISIMQSLGYVILNPFFAYIPLDSYFEINDKEFYLKLLLDYDNLLEKTFHYLKKVYEDLTGNKELLTLFEEAVKERKKQLNLG